MVASILTIFFGQRYASRQEEQMLENSLYAQNGLDGELEENGESSDEESDNGSANAEGSDAEVLSEYEANQDSLSFVESLHYNVLSNGDATLTYYGDIDTSQPWYSSMNESIHEQTGDGVSIQDVTYSEIDTYDLYINQTTSNVIETNPDMLVYGMPALADHVRDIGLSDTEQYLSSILNTLTEALPDTEIVLLEPYPLVGEMDNFNSRMLDYRSYMSTMNEVAVENNLPVISMHGQFLSAAEEAGTELSSLFQEDQVTLNESGVELYTEVLQAQLSEPLNQEETTE